MSKYNEWKAKCNRIHTMDEMRMLPTEPKPEIGEYVFILGRLDLLKICKKTMISFYTVDYYDYWDRLEVDLIHTNNRAHVIGQYFNVVGG